MKALIAPNETYLLKDGSSVMRICETRKDKDIFPVNDSLFWVDCAEDVTTETHHWNGKEITINSQEVFFETPKA